MILTLLILVTVIFAVQALRSRRLIASALWLAGVSAMLSIALYWMGAHQLAVVELSVGAGLVTVLFVFAICIAGEEAMQARSLIPKPLAWALVVLAVLILGWMVIPVPIPAISAEVAPSQPSFTDMLWQQRGLDVLVQVVLIFAGVLGLLGLLAEAKAPLEGAAAEEMAIKRDQELVALQEQAFALEKEVE